MLRLSLIQRPPGCALIACLAVTQAFALAGHAATAPRRGVAEALPYDPFCRVGSEAGIVSLRPLPASTRRMVERLQQVLATADPASMAYLNDRLVTNLVARIAGTRDLRRAISLRFDLGRQRVQSGDPEGGLKEFDQLEQQVYELGGTLAGNRALDLRLMRSIGYLRLGEQENCLDHHNSQSCILPIQPAGQHHLQRGARGAIRELTEVLRLVPGDLRARWLLNIASMTVGEWPNRVPEPWRIPARAFASEHDLGRFPDIAGPLGVAVDDLAGGCILDDFDNDGLIDIIASSWSLTGQLRYFRNHGRGGFEERTAESGLVGLTSGLNIQQTDYNNDGWLDIWVLRGAWLGTVGRIPNSLLRNNRDGTFTDVTEEAGIFSQHPTQAATWLDYNGDGWLDVFIGNESWDPREPDPCELFRNNGDGTFTECAAESGVAAVGLVKGVTSADIDNDGDPDLFVSCRDSANRLFRNEGAAGTNTLGGIRWRFSDVSARAGVGETVRSFPTWFFDYDNDGSEDLFVSGYLIRSVADVAADYLGLPHQAARLRLYRNLGDGTFTNVTAAVGLNRLCHTMGCNFGDLDNDGWLDFYLGTGDPDFATLIPNRVFRNADGKRFQDITTSGGFGQLQKGHGVGFADLDNDGDQDIYAVIGGAFAGDRYPNSLFQNPGHGNHWLKLHCVGERSNRAAIGTRIKIVLNTPQGKRTIHKTVNSGGSFGSSPLRQEFGLGDATGIDHVELFWPTTRERQRFAGLELDRAYRIHEGASAVTSIELPRLTFPAPGADRHAASPAGPATGQGTVGAKP